MPAGFSVFLHSVDNTSIVMPAKAGIYWRDLCMDPRLREDDVP